MSDGSTIEWLARPSTKPATWNPVTGCTKCSPGCKNCYAERMSKRLAGRHGYPEAPRNFDVTLHPDKLAQPRHWRKPRTIFVVSMGDLFHEKVPYSYIQNVWNIMETADQHTFLVLTKRPDRMLDFLTSSEGRFAVRGYMRPLPNVWLGVTAENQNALKQRWPVLQQVEAAIKFLSVEPMLDDVFAAFEQGWSLPDWISFGGESGTGARPMHPNWLRAGLEFCRCWGIPPFFKQWGAWAPYPTDSSPSYAHHYWWDKEPAQGRPTMHRIGKKAAGHLLDGKEYREWPTT
ncbi:MAG: DUF5131 family protein [Anaerolineae bacterium]|nr:DUF5131 family protein [Anaerolineae bacterium]